MKPNDTPPSAHDSRIHVIEGLRADMRDIRPALPPTWPSHLLFKNDLGLDSLDLVELMARIEQRYQILIEDSDLPLFVSLDAMADYLCARKGHERRTG